MFAIFNTSDKFIGIFKTTDNTYLKCLPQYSIVISFVPSNPLTPLKARVLKAESDLSDETRLITASVTPPVTPNITPAPEIDQKAYL